MSLARHALLVQLPGLVLRGLAWGTFYGTTGGALIGTIVYPIVGTMLGATFGGAAGIGLGLTCGAVLAGYVGFARGCLGRNQVIVAETFPLIALVVVGVAAIYYWSEIGTLPAVLNVLITVVALATCWLAARSTARWYLGTEGYTPEQARAALHHRRLRRPRPSP